MKRGEPAPSDRPGENERPRDIALASEDSELYRLLVDNANDLVSLYAVDGRRVVVSPSVTRVLGWLPETPLAGIHPDDGEILARGWERTLAGERMVTTLRHLHQDGTWRWLEAATSLVCYRGEPHVLAVSRDVTARVQAEAERQAHVWHLESLEGIHRALQRTGELDQVLGAVLDEVIASFGCDRAWVGYPCDPEAPLFHLTMERTRPEYPGALAAGASVPVDPETARVLDLVRAAPGAVRLGPGAEHPLPAGLQAHYQVQSMLVIGLRPRRYPAYVFGLHQCDGPRVWTAIEERLFQAVGRRLEDGLGALLTLRDLRESRARLEEAARIAQLGYWENDLLAERNRYSGEACRILGLPLGETLTLAQLRERIHPEDRARQAEASERALRGEARYDVHFRIVQPDGEVRALHSVGDFQRDAAGRAVRAFGVVQDVTERRRNEDALALFRSLVDHSRDGVEIVDAKSGRFLDVNARACRDHGYTREEYLALTVADIDPVVAERSWEAAVQTLLAGGPSLFQGQHRRKDGSLFPVEASLAHVRLDRDYVLAVVRDVTDRKRTEQEMAQSHNLLHAVVEGTSDAVYIKDLEGRYLLINTAGARFLGRAVEEVIGKRDEDLLPPESAGVIAERERRVYASGESQTVEETTTAAGVTRTYVASRAVYRDALGSVLGLVGISSDVTELKLLEDQLRQAQKMEAIGALAGGVAHDFNNLLTVITGYGELARARLDSADAGRELLGEVLKAAGRATNLTRQLLAFGRKQVLQPRVVSLNDLLAESLKLLQRLIREDIDLVLRSDPGLGQARVDPAQFEQAVINLVVNARDALPAGGRILIGTSNEERAPRPGQPRRPGQPGPYVALEVSDDGVGMDAETRRRMFEPFFTTKAVGEGTGLGLAMVYGFVRQSGGEVEVESAPGVGTTVRILLPRVAEAAAGTRAAPEAGTTACGTETVLVVEDEAQVRRLGRTVLEANGYTVLEARDGEEALVVAARHKGTIHLLLSDLVMPRMGGRQVAEALLRSRPDLRILFMSGYSQELTEGDGANERKVPLLQKPFKPSDLTSRVREVLDGRKGEGG